MPSSRVLICTHRPSVVNAGSLHISSISCVFGCEIAWKLSREEIISYNKYRTRCTSHTRGRIGRWVVQTGTTRGLQPSASRGTRPYNPPANTTSHMQCASGSLFIHHSLLSVYCLYCLYSQVPSLSHWPPHMENKRCLQKEDWLKINRWRGLFLRKKNDLYYWMTRIGL